MWKRVPLVQFSLVSQQVSFDLKVGQKLFDRGCGFVQDTRRQSIMTISYFTKHDRKSSGPLCAAEPM